MPCSKHAEVTVRRWLIGKGMGGNSSRNVQPKLLPVDFRPPPAVIAQSN
jgi:hypothetical protein